MLKGVPLYVVATPIGNLDDLSPRAELTLREADVVACEDTRVTRKLLASRRIETPVERFDAHVERDGIERWLERVAGGAHVALVSDAGTPTISDPGRRLVAACLDRELPVHPIPGPSALATALSVSGFPGEPCLFLGFIARSGRARREALAMLRTVPATAVLYESATRLPGTLKELAARFPDRMAVVARELTKRHESLERGTLSDLVDRFSEAPKGEVVLLVSPPEAAVTPDADVDERIAELLRQGHSPRRVAEQVAAETGASRRHVYQRVLARRSDPQGVSPGSDE